MTVQINIPGACLVKTGTGTSDALEDLGYSIDGVDIEERTFQEGVPGDQNGGTSGPPLAKQFFGQIHIVTMELSKWDPTVFAKVQPRVNDNGTTAEGAIVTPGTLIDTANSNFYRLLLNSTSLIRNYLGAIPLDIFTNRGSKFARVRIVWECHAVSGVMFNTTTA